MTAAPSRLLGSAPPTVLLLLSIVSAHMGAAFAYFLFPLIGPLGTVSLRLVFSAAILVLITRPSMASFRHRQGWMIVLYGLLMAGMNSSFYMAIDRIPLGIAITVAFIGPLGISIAMSRRFLDFIWVALALAGIVLLTPDIGETLDPVGLLLAAIDGICWSGLVLVSPRMAKFAPGNTGLALGMSVAALVMLPIGLSKAPIIAADPILLLYGFGIALLSTTITFTLEYEALKRLSVRLYGLIISLEPASATIFGAVILGQSVGLKGIAAIACVTLAATGATLTKKRDDKQDNITSSL
ncbi:MAG: EamA family transporter [Alphaproteobacteria bacterium]|nr:EamA family transporter [Alphaproteobacteria bacterium]